jgi:hypothetical protein
MSEPLRIQPNGLVGSYVITQGDRLLMTGLTLQGCHDWIAARESDVLRHDSIKPTSGRLLSAKKVKKASDGSP